MIRKKKKPCRQASCIHHVITSQSSSVHWIRHTVFGEHVCEKVSCKLINKFFVLGFSICFKFDSYCVCRFAQKHCFLFAECCFLLLYDMAFSHMFFYKLYSLQFETSSCGYLCSLNLVPSGRIKCNVWIL